MRTISLVLSLLLSLWFPMSSLAQATLVAIEEGTPVRLKLEEAVSTKTSTAGQKLHFVAAEDVMSKDGKTVVIKEGAPATGYLVNVDEKGFGKGGKLNIEVTSVKAIDDSKVVLRGMQAKSGHNGAGVGSYVVGGVLLGVLGIGIVALCGQGKHAEIPAGTIVTAFIEHDTNVAMTAPTSNIAEANTAQSNITLTATTTTNTQPKSIAASQTMEPINKSVK